MERKISPVQAISILADVSEAEMNGRCGTRVNDTLGTPGVQASIADAWNGRFGIYKSNSGPTLNRPDFTGYAYTATNWPSGQNAYSGTPGTGAPHNVRSRPERCAHREYHGPGEPPDLR